MTNGMTDSASRLLRPGVQWRLPPAIRWRQSVTLSMAIVAPWGIWTCNDHRVIDLQWDSKLRQWRAGKRDDFSVKHLELHCPDGSALVTYSGLGKVNRTIHVSDWLRRLIRGETRTLDETLIRIREAATAELAKPAAAAGVEHTFIAGAFLQRRPWAVAITNTQLPPGSPPRDHFITDAVLADETPRLMVVGAGRDAISEKDRALLKRIIHYPPKRSQDYSQVLADIHRRAKHSNHPARHTLSEGCLTAHMWPSGRGHGIKAHWSEPEHASGKRLPVPPRVHSGIDYTELMDHVMRRMDAARAGERIDEEESTRLGMEAGRRAVQPPEPKRQ
jgi:hypothetical protein